MNLRLLTRALAQINFPRRGRLEIKVSAPRHTQRLAVGFFAACARRKKDTKAVLVIYYHCASLHGSFFIRFCISSLARYFINS